MRIVNSQAEMINFLRRQVENLERENAVLKASLVRDVLEVEKSFRELEPYFDRLSGLVYKTILSLVKLHRTPVNYEQIVRAFRARHRSIDVKTQTIMRLVRKLKERGLLHSPQQGLFIPVKKKEKTISVLGEEGEV